MAIHFTSIAQYQNNLQLNSWIVLSWDCCKPNAKRRLNIALASQNDSPEYVNR